MTEQTTEQRGDTLRQALSALSRRDDTERGEVHAVGTPHKHAGAYGPARRVWTVDLDPEAVHCYHPRTHDAMEDCCKCDDVLAPGESAQAFPCTTEPIGTYPYHPEGPRQMEIARQGIGPATAADREQWEAAREALNRAKERTPKQSRFC